MVHGHERKLDAPAVEERVRSDEQGIHPLARESSKGLIDLVARVGLEGVYFLPDRTGRRLHLTRHGIRATGVAGIDEHAEPIYAGQQLAQNPYALWQQFRTQKIDTGCVAARPGEAGNETHADRIFRDTKDNGDRTGCRFGGASTNLDTRCCNHAYLAADQIGRQFRQPIELTFGPAIFDGDITTFDIAGFRQPLTEGCKAVSNGFGRHGTEEPDYRHRLLLRCCRKRPPRRRAAKQRDEVAPSDHSITSSASARSLSGISIP